MTVAVLRERRDGSMALNSVFTQRLFVMPPALICLWSTRCDLNIDQSPVYRNLISIFSVIVRIGVGQLIVTPNI